PDAVRLGPFKAETGLQRFVEVIPPLLRKAFALLLVAQPQIDDIAVGERQYGPALEADPLQMVEFRITLTPMGSWQHRNHHAALAIIFVENCLDGAGVDFFLIRMLGGLEYRPPFGHRD